MITIMGMTIITNHDEDDDRHQKHGHNHENQQENKGYKKQDY